MSADYSGPSDAEERDKIWAFRSKWLAFKDMVSEYHHTPQAQMKLHRCQGLDCRNDRSEVYSFPAI
jgi:hypothetical protein